MRYVGLFLCALSFSSIVYAQSFQAYAELGINASQIDGDDLFGYNQPGLRIGAHVALPLDSSWLVRGGMVFSGKGSRHGERDLIFQIIRLSYLELPLVAQYALLEQVSLTAGFTVNYLIGAQQDLGGGFESSRENYRNIDVCYTAGVVYKPFDNASFSISIINGLASASSLEFFRNRSLAFSLFYHL
ncbi:outer membrane beta-barrel protein [Tunicatimonas pelagia]|uniref:outer membrane beta-barrel protein n=1 Tax=Tunicatimonas pelagia TaxID=931531 RepID=UPI0026659FAA|nr:outer membrane beta-barrel protein [Tunicatimonas pelagia]WKN46081.1 outer membrane beta-barrel protein [Tunicatimonas pelagia]